MSSTEAAAPKPDQPSASAPATESDVKAPNLLERAKEEIEAIVHSEHAANKETNEKREDINENTPVEEVKAPNVFERAKEEVEAFVETIHPKKEAEQSSTSKNEGGFWAFLAKRFEKVCAPFDRKSD